MNFGERFAPDIYDGEIFAAFSVFMLVARRLSKHGYKITKNRKVSSASVIRGWRMNVDLNRVRDERDNTLRDLGHIEGTNEAKAEKLLQQLPGIVSVKS